MQLSLRLLGTLPLVATVVVGATVGVRLLLLARRTRCFPELAIGLGLMLMTAVGMPLAALGRLPVLLRTPTGDLLFGSSMAVIAAGLVLLWAFTWRVFRPEQAWARVLFLAASVCAAVVTAGLVRASMQAETLPEIVRHMRPWGIALVALISGAFAWTGTESLIYYRRSKLRLALGLSDPVLVNRFMLWATTGIAMALLTFFIAVLLAQGRTILADPLALSLISAAAAVGGTTWSLTFLAPARYVAFVRRRAAPGG